MNNFPTPLVGNRREDLMFYPVRIFNKKGQLKKIVASESLSQKYWNKVFDPTRKNIQITVKGLSKRDRALLGWEPDEILYSQD